MAGAAKILSVLGESKDASLHIFNIALLHPHVAMKNGRFNMADTAASSMFGSL